MTTSISRRSVLGGAAGGVLAVGVGAGLDEADATLKGSLPKSVDVVVVGGGLSGLVTARQLRAKGHSVLVLEARGRVGGRIHNQPLRDGSVIESGGAFIGPTQDRIAALAKELKVKTFKEYTDGKSVYVTNGHVRPFNGTVPTIQLGLLAPDALLLQNRIDNLAAQIDVNAPWEHPKAAEWDKMTLHEWIVDNAAVDGVVDVIGSWTEPSFGSDPHQLSLLFTLWYVACSGNETTKGTFERNANTSGGAQESRFVGGSGRIPHKIAKRLGDAVAVHAPVRRIVQKGSHAMVHSDRGTVRAKRVVVAAPPEVVLDIDFAPGLPLRRQELLKHMPMGNLMKCDAVYKKPFWRAAGRNGFGIATDGPTRAVFDNSPPDSDLGVLLAFVGGDTWRRYGLETAAARRKAVLGGFAQMFGDEALHPLDFIEHDWNREPWTGGGPVAVMGPGTMSSFGSSIRQPHGRVHWAGTETSTYWTGYMDGAVRAGERAADEVHKVL